MRVFLTYRNLAAEFHRENVSFNRKAANSLCLWITYAIHLQLAVKLMVEFLYVIITHVLQLLQLRH